jgi:PhnB protein
MDDAAPSTIDSAAQTFIRQLGRRVRAARETAGISQSRLEREADLRPTTIARLSSTNSSRTALVQRVRNPRDRRAFLIQPTAAGEPPARHRLLQAVTIPPPAVLTLACKTQPTSRARGHEVTSRLNPYISFADNARQAMEFYQGVFGGSLTLNTFGEYGAQDSPDAKKIMHGMLETSSGYTLMGADTPSGMEYNPGTNIAVSLSGDDGDELRGYWEKLSDGGTVSVPLEKQMWGDEFGRCVDRGGITWMVNIGLPQA